MQNEVYAGSNFKRSATMTGIVKGQRRELPKTKTHVRYFTIQMSTSVVSVW